MRSLAAAAAAAEAYLRVSPGARVGGAAGFILLVDVPLGTVDRGACKVAIAGSGLLSCAEGRLAILMGGSDIGFGFPGTLLGLVSTSGVSSCIDWVS